METSDVHEDVWIPTVCANCFSFCPIRAHRVDGVIVKIEGNPDDPLTQGRICARGLSGINILYDPNRLNYPVRRTNPNKGRGIDPKWERISWEEALDTIAAKLREVREDDPRKLVASFGVNGGPQSYTLEAFAVAYGTPNIFVGGAGNHCASGKHFIGGLTHASWVSQPDFNFCNYFLNFGVPVGTGAYYGVNAAVRKMADARARGMKHVVLDPWMGMPAQSADEWVPIIPGTDAAVALAMTNLLLNEYRVYDHEYLEHETNGPYLVGDDGHYLRDADDKPQMWDAVEDRPKPYDAAFNQVALEVDRVVDGRRWRSAFSVIKEHVKRYTPELATEISGVPVVTIRRLAREFGSAARIGETIVLEGHELPFRPVALSYFKGPQAHKHSALISTALELLSAIVGVRSVPGSYVGINSRSLGHPETGFPKWSPTDGPDGLLVTGRWVVPPSQPWPPVYPKKPEDLGLGQLIPPSHGNTPMLPLVSQDPARYGIDYKPAVQIMVATNFAMSLSDPEVVEGFFKDIFTVNFNLFLDESAELSDIVLPDCSYLERLDVNADWMANGCATDSWSYPLRQPAVAPIAERRSASSVLLDLAERVGITPDINAVMNVSFGFREPYLLESDRQYTLEEVVDARYKSWFGEQFGLEWMRKHGILAWPKRVDEVYWHSFVKTRIPIYFEHFLTFKETLEGIQRETGLFLDLDLDDYQPYPDWRPCAAHTEPRPEFDLTAIYFRIPFQSFTSTGDNAWLDEVSTIDTYANRININTATAAKKGIVDGDWIELESAGTGKTVRGRARLTQCVHPEVVAMSGHGGHWARGLPLASQPGKGINFNRLLKQDFAHMDTLSLNLDLCAKVKVTKVGRP
ncbi:MAG: molybdopterin-dependent oxidoreductase [Chloroflexi bacterium]|nr:molybdopterin-dependent oxidoreductase [Chloroflexota bacterium]MCL5735665.1 molybdopterin-dependent oxidoreductase [Actinomycetota bacterium]